jgi:hypothetical protein
MMAHKEETDQDVVSKRSRINDTDAACANDVITGGRTRQRRCSHPNKAAAADVFNSNQKTTR